MARTKLHDPMLVAAAALRADAAASLRLAEELEARARNPENGAAFPAPIRAKPLKKRKFKLKLRSKQGTQSYLVLAVEALKEQKKPVHVRDLVPLVQEKRGQPTTRASVESALVRGMETARWRGIIRRTAPGTFAVQ